MADMLTIGSAAANTFKTALDVTSHNVANVSTEGYSRQRAEISNNTANVVSSGFLGGGSAVDSIQRIQADYVQTQLYSTNSGVERYSNQLQMSTQVEGIVASNDEGIQEFLQRFYDSLQNLADNPTSGTSRQLVLDEAENLESHINNLSIVLDDTQQQVNSQISDLTTEVNSRLEVIQTINNQVSRALSSGTQPPNDLLDQRDQAILELSSYVDIKTYAQENGRIDIHTANGRLPLLSDNTLTRLEAGIGEYRDENRTEVYMTIGDQREIITDYLTGGALGGVIDFRSNMLDQTQNDLGVTLNALTASTNWQHYQGWDLNGEAGLDFFKPLETQALKSTDNTGAEDGSNILVSFDPYPDGWTDNKAPYDGLPGHDQESPYVNKLNSLQNAFDNIAEMQSKEYKITYVSASDEFSFYDRQTGNRITDENGNNVTVANGSTADVDGINFDFTGTMALADGDSFIVQPHKAILSNFESAMDDINKIASRGQSPLADSYNASWDANNDQQISYDEFIGFANTDADPALSVAEFDALTGGVNGSALDVDGNNVIDKKEFSLILASDSAPAAYGDNVNMANMASLYTKQLMFSDGSGEATETIMGGYSTMASNVGMYVRGSDIQLTAQENVHQQILMQRESISGVSLDEEAANLMRYQQAYEAAAQIIATSQSIFQTLLSAVRG